jgi:hypothetical protein
VTTLLERALLAEERVEELEGRVRDLESRLRGALNADPTTASSALSWISRAENGERLLGALLRRIGQRSIDTREFPDGWVAQAEGQMRTVTILKRDQAAMAERPDAQDYWTESTDALGRRSVVRDKSGWMHAKKGS